MNDEEDYGKPEGPFLGEAGRSVQRGERGKDGRTLIPGHRHVADVSFTASSTDLSIISIRTLQEALIP